MVSDMGCGLKAAGQTRIHWNGPFKMQLEPAAEIGIPFRWGNRWGAPGTRCRNQIYGTATNQPNGFAETGRAQAGGDNDARSWNRISRRRRRQPERCDSRHWASILGLTFGTLRALISGIPCLSRNLLLGDMTPGRELSAVDSSLQKDSRQHTLLSG